MVPFHMLIGFLLVWYSNFVRKMHLFDLKNALTLKTELRVREGP